MKLPEISLNPAKTNEYECSVMFIEKEKADKPVIFKGYIEKEMANGQKTILVSPHEKPQVFVVIKPTDTTEDFRQLGADLSKLIQTKNYRTLSINCDQETNEQILSYVEGLLLASYRFLSYYKKEEIEKKTFPLHEIGLVNCKLASEQINRLLNRTEMVFWARNQVNEPANTLTTPEFAQRIVALSVQSGIKHEVYKQKKIEAMQMGGLLAVNQGSIDPPVLVELSWKPQNAINKKPLLLVGKGITYDTGGLSLKPTASMDTMKTDMAGAAAVAATLALVAKNKLNVWVEGLIPITDNRLQASAIAPGDVIKMHSGLFVEVLNTDAEGRLILADAISFGQKYDPLLTIDIATLTGSAQVAIGQYASVFMGNAPANYMNQLLQAGDDSNERLVQFPFWDDYAETLKSDIADLKNIGGKEAGAITAGKFLEKFCSSPYIHIDIAGTAYQSTASGYKPKGATGVGVRLFSEFLEKISIEPDKN